VVELKSLKKRALIIYLVVFSISFGLLLFRSYKNNDYYYAIIGILVLSAFSVVVLHLCIRSWFARNENFGSFGALFFIIGTIIGMIFILVESITGNEYVIIGFPFFTSVCLASYYQYRFIKQFKPGEYKRMMLTNKKKKDEQRIVI
jgi:O-antigen/teichoic acid export membrane protein